MTRKKKKIIEDMDYEILFYEGLLEKKPDFIQAMEALGDLYTKRGFFEKGLKVDVKLSLLKPEDPYVFYNLACSYSLLEHTDKALRSIKQAFNYGYKDIDFLENDHDLENLKNDSRFKRYFSRVKNKREESKKEVSSKSQADS